MTAPTVFTQIDEGLYPAKVLPVQSYVQPDGSSHYLYRYFEGRGLQKIIQRYAKNDEPEKLNYSRLRQWKYNNSQELSTCPHCQAEFVDLIAAARWYTDHPLNWIAECPTCLAWCAVVTG